MSGVAEQRQPSLVKGQRRISGSKVPKLEVFGKLEKIDEYGTKVLVCLQQVIHLPSSLVERVTGRSDSVGRRVNTTYVE